MSEKCYAAYVASEDETLYTAVMLPDGSGTFPVIIQRNPYVENTESMTDEEALQLYVVENRRFLDAGYGVVLQHCRGTGKSTGAFLPFVHEQADGLSLQEWIRRQPFYRGELYLYGGSYTAAVHLATAPFADDIKGAALFAFDQERYGVFYRNGILNTGLCGEWYTGMYRKRDRIVKSSGPDSFRTLPLSAYTKTVFGEEEAVFDEILKHPRADDPFWNTLWGGSDSRHALDHAGIPILMAAGFFDVFYQGMADMWKDMDEKTRRMSSYIVTPYDHSGGSGWQPVQFADGKLDEHFTNVVGMWFDQIRGMGDPPVESGKVTYYSMFENKWKCDDYVPGKNRLEIPLGKEEVHYVYNPFDPSRFRGGLSSGFSGTAFQAPPGEQYGIQTFYSDAFLEDQYLKGRIGAELTVKSDREDTCFYMRLSLAKEEGDFGLRDDIHSLSEFAPDYAPGEEVVIRFTFDDLALPLKKGERLRIDVSSSAYPFFVPHTNKRGLYSVQSEAFIAHNTLVCGKSKVTLPII